VAPLTNAPGIRDEAAPLVLMRPRARRLWESATEVAAVRVGEGYAPVVAVVLASVWENLWLARCCGGGKGCTP